MRLIVEKWILSSLYAKDHQLIDDVDEEQEDNVKETVIPACASNDSIDTVINNDDDDDDDDKLQYSTIDTQPEVELPIIRVPKQDIQYKYDYDDDYNDGNDEDIVEQIKYEPIDTSSRLQDRERILDFKEKLFDLKDNLCNMSTKLRDDEYKKLQNEIIMRDLEIKRLEDNSKLNKTLKYNNDVNNNNNNNNENTVNDRIPVVNSNDIVNICDLCKHHQHQHQNKNEVVQTTHTTHHYKTELVIKHVPVETTPAPLLSKQPIMCDKCVETVNNKSTQTTTHNVGGGGVVGVHSSIEDVSSVELFNNNNINNKAVKPQRVKKLRKVSRNNEVNGKQLLLHAYLNDNTNSNNKQKNKNDNVDDEDLNTTPIVNTTSENEISESNLYNTDTRTPTTMTTATTTTTTTTHESGMGTFNEEEVEDDVIYVKNSVNRLNVKEDENIFRRDVVLKTTKTVNRYEIDDDDDDDLLVKNYENLNVLLNRKNNNCNNKYKKNKNLQISYNFKSFKDICKTLFFIFIAFMFLLLVFFYYLYRLFNPVCCDMKRNYLFINYT